MYVLFITFIIYIFVSIKHGRIIIIISKQSCLCYFVHRVRTEPVVACAFLYALKNIGFCYTEIGKYIVENRFPAAGSSDVPSRVFAREIFVYFDVRSITRPTSSIWTKWTNWRFDMLVGEGYRGFFGERDAKHTGQNCIGRSLSFVFHGTSFLSRNRENSPTTTPYHRVVMRSRSKSVNCRAVHGVRSLGE